MSRKKLIFTLISLLVIGATSISIGISSGDITNFYLDKTGIHTLTENTTTFHEDSLSVINNIEIDTSVTYDIDIIEGNNYSLNYTGTNLSHSFNDGLLTISDTITTGEPTTKFIFHGGLSSIYTSTTFPFDTDNHQITITVPKSSTVDHINFLCHSGDIQVGDISASTLSMVNEYGDVDFSGTTAQTVDVAINNGTLSMDNMTAPSFMLTSDYGDVTILNTVIDNLNAKIKNGDFTANNLNATSFVLSSNYGDVTFSNSNIDTCDTIMENGELTIHGLLSNTFNLSSDYGNMFANNFTVTNLRATLDSGNYEMTGSIKNSGNFISKYGDITLNLENSETEFSTDISTDYGEIDVNGKPNGTLTDSTKIIKAYAKNGDISIQFDTHI